MPLEGSFCTNHWPDFWRISQHNGIFIASSPFLGASTPSIRAIGRVFLGWKALLRADRSQSCIY